MKAENGKHVKVQFVGKLDDGTVFGQASAEKPLEFTLGQESIIAGFAEAVRGMEPGEEKKVNVPAEKAFGNYDPEKVVTFKREQLTTREPIEKGMEVVLKDTSGQEFVAHVDSFTNDSVQLDLNHPLAGQNLQFDIRVQEVA